MITWNEYTWYSKWAALIFFIAVLPAWTFYLGMQFEKTWEIVEHQNSYPMIITIPSTTTPSPAISTSTTMTDVYPFYSGLTWGTISASTKQIGDLKLIGSEVVSVPIKNISNLSAISQTFEKYYDQKLISAGWTIDNTVAAGGPGSSIWGYKKGNEYIILSFGAKEVNPSLAQPFSCPCNLGFSIFEGKAQ